jgi:hypothetical protein
MAPTQACGAGPTPDGLIADALARLIKEGVRSTVADEVLGFVRRAVDDNRDVAVRIVQDRSRWWIASVVDRRVADLVVDGVLSLLDQLRAERSDLRTALATAVDQLVDGLAAQGVLARIVSDGCRQIVGSGAIDTIVLRIAEKHRDRIRERIVEDPDGWSLRLPA